jgi:transmembrane sensor
VARRALVFGFATAAAAAMAFVVIKAAIPPVQQMAYAAPSDSALTVTLPDESKMTLNRGTSARVSWSTRERRVDLAQGEAAFDVTHNAGAPFVVATGAATIRDLGTEFNVLSERNALTVSVRSGSVAVRALGATATLARGEQARVSSRQMTVSQVNPDDALAWREGRLTYHDATLSQVIADLNRYSTTPIRVADDRTASLRFSGVLVIDSSSSMTRRLEAFLPVRTEQNAQGIVVGSR